MKSYFAQYTIDKDDYINFFRTNACENAVCRKNELCHDHWFYHTCQCQSPYFGEQCEQSKISFSLSKLFFFLSFLVAPIVKFNSSSLVDISLSSPISNLSFFFNTLQSNGTLFQLISSSKQNRFTRDLSSPSKIIGALVNGRFRLMVIDNEHKPQEYELRSEHKLNDGRPHQIQLDLNHNRLIIDGIYNETLTKINNKIIPNKIEFISDGSLNGWLQDVRINNQRISLVNTSQPTADLNVTTLNMKQLDNNPCYPNNPCRNQGICLVTNLYEYL
jgi:hypothetical protein